MTTLIELVAAIQDIAETVTSVRSAPDSVPSELSATPAIITYPTSGDIRPQSYGFADELHKITLEIWVDGEPYKAFPMGLQILVDLVRKFEADPTLGGKAETFGSITYTFNRKEFIWFVYLNNVKLINTWA